MKKTGLILGIISFLFLSAIGVKADIVSYWSGYTKSVESKVVSNFVPPKTKESLSATLSLNINKDGSVSSHKIVESSGNADFDDAAMKAVEASIPFNPFPSEIIDSHYNMLLKLESVK